ncbi:hypothetical protein D9M68_783440 [compost metagenome]|jgi:hypothetical protein
MAKPNWASGCHFEKHRPSVLRMIARFASAAQNLKKNEDGSVDLYVGPKAPEGWRTTGSRRSRRRRGLREPGAYSIGLP